MEDKTQILQVNPTTFEFQQYTEQDNILISSSRLDTSFTSSTDYIEYYAYDENKNLIFPTNPDVRAVSVTTFSVINGDTILNPPQDLEDIGYDYGSYFSTYNFYRKKLASDITINYYISEISSDRTEVRLKSNAIADDLIISSSNEFIQHREDADYFVDFFLNFGNDQQVISNNLRLDTDTEVEPSLLVKLYEPLPSQFGLKSTLWVVEEISVSQAYNVIFPEIEFVPNDFQFIKGPNYSIQVTQEIGESTQVFDYNTLIGSDLTSSFSQLNNLLRKKEINISVDYTNYNNFINFSSANTRLENFYYKVGLIESYNTSIETLGTIGGGTPSSPAYSESKATYISKIDYIKDNFDGYEYFLYYNSGSIYSYPKSNTSPPYALFPTGSTEVLTWLGSADPQSSNYGGRALTASNYDLDNSDYLYNTIPEYLRSDSANQKYELFVDMVAQQYDNIWLYTKDLTNRFNADNRLDYGISKDLVADAIRNFGVKLYSNNFNTNDLYTSFLGITPSGSTFPFPDMTGSYPAPSGYEYVTNQISASNDIVPLDDVNKSLYKRIYHNIPYLLKTKGTIAGLRALITSYGIPNTILRVNEYGGQDRQNYKDWDYSQNQFNYAYHLDGTNNVTSSFVLSSPFLLDSDLNTPKTLQFRFKTPGIPTASAQYNVWVANTSNAFITLDYNGSGMNSGSYSGAVPSQSNAYGTLTLYPDGGTNLISTASLYLPFFDGGWWSVMAVVDHDGDEPAADLATLYAANRIDNAIGFSGSDSTSYNWQYWDNATKSSFPLTSGVVIDGIYHAPLTGALQEIRYWDVPLSESLFYDYVVNPYSTQGNTINSTPDNLAFRADLGTLLDTGSGISTHPKVTGSWEITQSFASGDSYFHTSSNSYVTNYEEIYLNQIPGGIKNKITDKVHIANEIIPEGSTLSPFRSIQQNSYVSSSEYSINYLEVAFSPTDQVNDDIIAQIGAFNMGDYIGDPRQISESGYTYPNLDTLRDEYFKKYISSYDINDFIRLIKFFDNSLFKMIQDFTPANTTLSSGVVIKQNLLERNRQAPPAVKIATTMSVYYTGSPSEPFSTVVPQVQRDLSVSGTVKSFARDYQLPDSSSSYPQYSTVSGSSIYVYEGGTGGTFDAFNTLYNAPISYSGTPYSGKTQAEVNNSTFYQLYTGSIQEFSESVYPQLGTQLPNALSLTSGSGQGLLTIPRIDQREFYNGEFQPVPLNVGANDICSAFFGQNGIISYRYFVQFFNNITFPQNTFLSPLEIPQNGNTWFWADTLAPTVAGEGLSLISSEIYTTANTANGNYDISTFTYSNLGIGGTIRLTVSNNVITAASFTDSSGQYNPVGTFTIDGYDLSILSPPIFINATSISFSANTRFVSRIPTNRVKYIKMSDISSNGQSLLPYVNDSTLVTFNLNQAYNFAGLIRSGPQTWYINGTSQQDDNNSATTNATLIFIDELPSSDAVASNDANSYDLSFEARGEFIWHATSSGEDPDVTPDINLTASVPQGYFPPGLNGGDPPLPTESFFRGWGQSTYYQTDKNGEIYSVGYGDGFSTDTFGNFNTGSIEYDGDSVTDSYSKSVYPWFMNAYAETTQVLTNSSLVGGLGQNDLQLYTGSITASSVQIGPTFIPQGAPPAATVATLTPIAIVVPPDPLIASWTGTSTTLGFPAIPSQNIDTTVTVQSGTPIPRWRVAAYTTNAYTTLLNPTWVKFGSVTPGTNNPFPGSSAYISGTDDLIINVSENTATTQRQAFIRVFNINNSSNKFDQTITQAAAIPAVTTNTFENKRSWSIVIAASALPNNLYSIKAINGSQSALMYFSYDGGITWDNGWTQTPITGDGTVKTIRVRMGSDQGGSNPLTGGGSETWTGGQPGISIQYSARPSNSTLKLVVVTNNIYMEDNNGTPYYLNAFSSDSSVNRGLVWDPVNATPSQNRGIGNTSDINSGSPFGRTFEFDTENGEINVSGVY